MAKHFWYLDGLSVAVSQWFLEVKEIEKDVVDLHLSIEYLNHDLRGSTFTRCTTDASKRVLRLSFISL